MLFQVGHLTRFRYDRPVVLEPHLVRLRPRSDLFQRLIAYDLTFDPEPQGRTESMDAQGNAVTQAWFTGASSSLSVRTSCTVETLCTNPFDYVVLDPDDLRLPMSYTEPERRALLQYLEPPEDPTVQAFAADVGSAASGGPTTFLVELCSRIAGSMEQVVRPVGEPYPAARTLELGSGACRDFAVLFMACCRAVGIAARFVTGYELGNPEGERDLHAWAEVYLRGAGWRAWDPTQGLAVADGHVAVAAGPSPAQAASTEGTFRGTGALATLDTVINLQVPVHGAASPGNGATSRLRSAR